MRIAKSPALNCPHRLLAYCRDGHFRPPDDRGALSPTEVEQSVSTEGERERKSEIVVVERNFVVLLKPAIVKKLLNCHITTFVILSLSLPLFFLPPLSAVRNSVSWK